MAKSDVIPSPRTEDRRSAILEIAWQAFLEQGYGGASMSDIAARLGGSKSTLYHYFPSKQELFLATAREKGHELHGTLVALPKQSADLATDLTNYGCGMLEIVLSKDYLEFYRLMIAEAARFPIIGEAANADRRSTLLTPLGMRFSEEMAAGRIRQGDPIEAGEVFWDLCSATVQRRALMAIEPKLSAQERRRLVDRAVSIFLAAYGCDAKVK